MTTTTTLPTCRACRTIPVANCPTKGCKFQIARMFRLIVQSPANELFGAVKYAIDETLTVRDGGIQVDTHTHGICEGARVNQRSEKFWPGVTMEAAIAYRKRSGYVER